MKHNFWLAKPYGLANQKLCYIWIYKSCRKRQNGLENSWWTWTQVFPSYGIIDPVFEYTSITNLKLTWPQLLKVSFCDIAVPGIRYV